MLHSNSLCYVLDKPEGFYVIEKGRDRKKSFQKEKYGNVSVLGLLHFFAAVSLETVSAISREGDTEDHPLIVGCPKTKFLPFFSINMLP